MMDMRCNACGRVVEEGKAYGYACPTANQCSFVPMQSPGAACTGAERVYLTPRDVSVIELHARIAALEAELASGSFYKESDIDAMQARIAALEAALAEIAHMGQDAPATYEGDEHIWQRRRAAMMQRIARAALEAGQ